MIFERGTQMNETLIREYRMSLTEVNYILAFTDNDIVKKIPLKFKKFLEENEALDYYPEIDLSKSLKDQTLKKYTPIILSMIYKDFICDENQRVEYENILKENQIKFEEEQKEKYSYEKLFQNNKINHEPIVQENLPVLKEKENIFTKIKNIILSWFKLKEK